MLWIIHHQKVSPNFLYEFQFWEYLSLFAKQYLGGPSHSQIAKNEGVLCEVFEIMFWFILYRKQFLQRFGIISLFLQLFGVNFRLW